MSLCIERQLIFKKNSTSFKIKGKKGLQDLRFNYIKRFKTISKTAVGVYGKKDFRGKRHVFKKTLQISISMLSFLSKTTNNKLLTGRRKSNFVTFDECTYRTTAFSEVPFAGRRKVIVFFPRFLITHVKIQQ